MSSTKQDVKYKIPSGEDKSLNSEILRLEELIQASSSGVSEAEFNTFKTSVTGDLATINAQIDGINDFNNNIEQDMESLSQQVEGFQTAIDNNTASITNINTSLSTINTKITTLNGQMSAANTDIESLWLLARARPLEEMTWEEIHELAVRNIAQYAFKVGDEKTFQLTTSESITVVILGFNHDDRTTGGKAGITFGMKNCLANKYPMDSTAEKTINWSTSDMHNTTMNMLYAQLPADLKTFVKEVVKKSRMSNSNNNYVSTNDKLFLLSSGEAVGNTSGSADEGEHYDYFVGDIPDRLSDRHLKRLSNGTGESVEWWLRSRFIGAATYSIVGISYIGERVNITQLGVSFAFCI